MQQVRTISRKGVILGFLIVVIVVILAWYLGKPVRGGCGGEDKEGRIYELTVVAPRIMWKLGNVCKKLIR